MTHEPALPSAPPTRRALFAAFFKIGALGFGGVAAVARHVIVVERKMLDERGFAEMFGLASTLPGANTVNLATMLGDKSGGVIGAAAAVIGLLSAPLTILVGAALLYDRFSAYPDVRAGLAGAAMAAAGLVAGTSLKILRGLEPDVAAVLMAAGVCLASALLKFPLLLILGISLPLSIGIGLFRASWKAR